MGLGSYMGLGCRAGGPEWFCFGFKVWGLGFRGQNG